MGEEWQFDIVNNPAAITRSDYERMWRMYQGESDDDSSYSSYDFSESSRTYEERSPEEIAAIQHQLAQNQIGDMVNEVRRKTYWALRVDEGMGIEDAYAECIRGEAILLEKLRQSPPESTNSKIAAWITNNPPKNLGFFLSSQGNLWNIKLQKAVKKAVEKREKALRKSSSGQAPGTATKVWAIGAVLLVIIVLAVWLMIRFVF